MVGWRGQGGGSCGGESREVVGWWGGEVVGWWGGEVVEVVKLTKGWLYKSLPVILIKFCSI